MKLTPPLTHEIVVTGHGAGGGPLEESLFTTAFENAAIGMALIGLDSCGLRVNPAFCEMLGYQVRELVNCSIHCVTHPDDVAEDLHQQALLVESKGTNYKRVKRYLHRDGHVVWGHLTCSLLRDGSGQPLHFIVQVQDITERKLAEELLRKSEERFRSLTLLSSDWYWEQDAQFRYTGFASNASDEAVWRPNQRDSIGKRRWELPGLFPLNQSWDQHRAEVQAHWPFRDFQYMRVREGEPVRYLSTSGQPVFDADGRLTGYRGTARDITQSKLAEQRLRETLSMLHMAAQVGRLGGWAYELTQPELTWSEEVCAIHEVRQGFAPTLEQTLGFYAPEYRQAMRGVFMACVRDGSPFDVEAQIVSAKGRRVWVRAIGEGEWDAQGRVRRIQGALQDISEGKRVAEQARLVADQLTTTLESLTDSFFTVDKDWRFTYVNAEFERVLGLNRQQLLGQKVWAKFPDLWGSKFETSNARAMAENVAVQFEEYYAPLRVWVQVKVYPSTQGLAVYIKDVSERIFAQQEILRLNGQLEERVKQRTSQLEAANKELEAFAYSIAHDLRAPLGSIDGFSRMLEQAAGPLLAERGRHYLTRIRAGVRQMGELTDGLLSLANLSRATLRNDRVDLAELALGALASLRESAPSRDVEISVARTLPVRGDPRLLAQVLSNLVGNAWKFTRRTGGARIEVGYIEQPNDGKAYFVRDNGAGFDMAHAARMFDAFYRMHEPTEFEGTGIGLAIVHKIISRHGGRIWAEAAPGQGACFYFTLGKGVD